MVWDGECDFCQYWIHYLKDKCSNNVKFQTYQTLSYHFGDIPEIEFKKASRFIEVDGLIFSGPNSIYKCLYYSRKINFNWNSLYEHNLLFKFCSDHSYNFIAKHRSFMFKLTKVCFGKNPRNLKLYWLLYLILLLLLKCFAFSIFITKF